MTEDNIFWKKYIGVFTEVCTEILNCIFQKTTEWKIGSEIQLIQIIWQ